MVPRITGLEATVAKLGASNERLKQKLHRKRKRNRATSLLPLLVSIPRPNIVLLDALISTTPLLSTTYQRPPFADHTYSPHQYPGPHSPLNHSHNQRSTPLLATDHNSSDHQSPNHQTHNHPSPTSCYADHNSLNHDPHPCEALVVDPLDHATPSTFILPPQHHTYPH
ncbi:hypothetical protein Bca52824_084100 [Brassica carinata]|uniref:Uncharacterized protein n=1 Tax=Brassica carinata TaxID=52824 RepID=A0A8X7TU92_BRACI|nr:hypothetical protein Bca52824_084100 [Brassica carinata]